MSDADLVDEQFRLLMSAAQNGDGEAYRELLTAVTPRIRRVVHARRAFLGSADVEDIVQDVLLLVHSARATYDRSRPFMPWLLAIVRYRLADAARRHARLHAREVVVDDIDVTFADPATKTESDRIAGVEAIGQALEALPAGQRQAIELLKLKEMSLKEASAASGLIIGALKVATHRAMISLRRKLRASAEHED